MKLDGMVRIDLVDESGHTYAIHVHEWQHAPLSTMWTAWKAYVVDAILSAVEGGFVVVNETSLPFTVRVCVKHAYAAARTTTEAA